MGSLLLWFGGTINSFAGGVFVLPLLTVLATSLGQERILKTWLPLTRQWEWIAPTAVGATVGWLTSLILWFIGLLFVFDGVIPTEAVELVAGGTIGLILGLFQAPVLRRYAAGENSARSVGPIWVLGNTLAWAIGFASYRSIVRIFSELDVTSTTALTVIHIEGWLLHMLVAAILTGIALLAILDRRRIVGP
jgi:hypothetical protein